MSSRHHKMILCVAELLEKSKKGEKKITDVAREFDIAHSVASRLWKSFKTTGMCSRWHGGGRVRSTTPADNRYIVLSAKRNRRTTAQQTARVFNVSYGQRSPDLNPIENVWDALWRQVAGRNYPPTHKNTLIRALTEEWDKLPQQLLDNVVQSMVRRVECFITLHGGHIPY
ncbi:hypothetical protein TNCV_1258001 [Trichonephila clavipes]|nr:hypothetical protein TNCV_1258001 [Trichonephila clavipes]